METLAEILIADDHPLFRKALCGILRIAFADLTVLEANSLAEAKKLAHDNLDMALIDLSMPDAAGFDALLTLRSAMPAIPIVVVSARADIDTMRKAAAYGAAAFIPKTATPDEMAQAIAAVLSGKRWWPKVAGPSPADPTFASGETLKRLSRCEARVLTLIAEGKSNKIIAYELDIKESTVKSHVTSLLRKLHVHSRTQAVLLAKQFAAQ